MATITNTNTLKLTSKKVIIFDVYGTLVDWESGIYTAIQPLLSRFPASRKWTRKEALVAVESVEKDLQVQHPEMLYWELLAKLHEVLEARLKAASGEEPGATTTLEGDPSTTSSTSASTSTLDPAVTESDTHIAFGKSIKDWPLFPDTFEALRTLSRYYKLVVLSNVDHTSFGYTHAKLSELSGGDPSLYAYPDPNPHKYWFPKTIPDSKSPFSLILTAQDTHCYKPSLGSYTAALECIETHLNTPKDEVLVVAQSLYHDHVPANQLGIKSVWIDRRGASLGMVPDVDGGKKKWNWRFETLGEMAEAVETEGQAGSA